MAVPIPNSSTGGILVPGVAPFPVPIYGDPLLDLFHDTIQGIIGFTDGSLVRPRWQPDPPNIPDFSVDWVAFGIVMTKKDWQPYQFHDPTANDGNGAQVFERDEELTILHSFYGPNSQQLQSQYEDGLQIDQNRGLLDINGIKLMSMQDAYQLPALLKEKWVKKVDQRVVFRRRIRRVYPTLTLLAANVDIINEQFTTHVVIP